MSSSSVMRRARWKLGRWRVDSYSALSGLRRRLPLAGVVALTFDDGPDPDYTPAVLDVLARHDVKATFFCVGRRVRAHPELVRRMVRDGHAVGSHSDTHRASAALPFRVLVRDLREGRRALEDVTGRRTRLFRPPHGHAPPRVMAAMRLAGVRGWLWSIDPQDYDPGRSVDEIVATMSGASDRDVVLLHDGMCNAPDAEDRSRTVEALESALGGFRKRGLRLVVLH